jgi:hypothetical protein
MAAMSARGSTPAMTAINDVLYRADGSPARGVLLISWPAFTTADGKPVAAGTKDVVLGTNGEVQIELAPNAGADPAGTYYKVVLKLEDGTTSTEYWVVPTSSPANISAIRSRLAPSSVAVQSVTRDYVDSALAGKANDTAVVHREGAEVINGLKQFTVAPSVPAPQANGDVVNKGYVDAAVVAVGEGSYVKKNGDTMTGPLTLAADPNSPMQASTRHYVDAAAASLVPTTALSTTPAAGLVPQAGTGAVLDLGWLGSSAGTGDKLLGKSGGQQRVGFLVVLAHHREHWMLGKRRQAAVQLHDTCVDMRNGPDGGRRRGELAVPAAERQFFRHWRPDTPAAHAVRRNFDQHTEDYGYQRQHGGE